MSYHISGPVSESSPLQERISLKNWKGTSGTSSASKKWTEFQKDFDWLIDEIENGYKNKRTFVIGWFNCINSITQCLQLGSGAGSKPLVNEERLAYFPFLRKAKIPTHTSDIVYNYDRAYSELSLDLIGETIPEAYMDRLNKEYIDLLTGTGRPSENSGL